MTDLVTESFPVWKAILWCFYPMAVLVMIELFLRGVNDDDDDDFSGGTRVRSQEPVMVPVPTGA